MKLQTTIKLSPKQPSIDYGSKVLLLGSCFSQNIGDKLEYFKFRQTTNPFGVIFHPLAIEKLLERAVKNKAFTQEDIFFLNEQWHCFEVHSLLSHPDKDVFLRNINEQLRGLKQAVENASHIIFTFGTAWVYKHIEAASVVANCHKVLQKNFKKKLLAVDEIVASLQRTAALISEINPSATLILTVSPVKHLKDGYQENTLSKAHLIAAIHEFKNFQPVLSEVEGSSTAKLQSYYFPSYELMMDELRDYRFYDEDLIHPNNTAIEIIWKRFNDVWISSETEATQKEIASIQRGLQHRPFFPESESHRAFSEELQKKIMAIQERFPHMKFTE